MKPLYCLLFLFVASSAQASQKISKKATPLDNKAYIEYSKKLAQKIATQKDFLKKKIRNYQTTLYKNKNKFLLWEDRKKIQKRSHILNHALKKEIIFHHNNLEHTEKIYSEIIASKDFLKIKNKYRKSKKHALKKISLSYFPLNIDKNTRLKMMRPFGQIKKKTAHFDFFSHGMTLGLTKNIPVQAVEDGKVVFDKFLEGKKRVLILKHKNNTLSIYGKLQKSKSLKKGKSVKKGSIIGRADSEFYFEIQKNGVSENPLKFFKNKTLAQLQITPAQEQ